MPGFVLARQVFEATRDIDWSRLEGIALMHHGLFTFNEDARASYDKMIELVSEAEAFLQSRGAADAITQAGYEATADDYLRLAQARQQASGLFGAPLIAHWKRDAESVGYSQVDGIEAIATRGPVTPDHTLHTKRIPAVLGSEPGAGIDAFEKAYLEYFAAHDDGSLTCLDPAPRYAVWKVRARLCSARTQSGPASSPTSWTTHPEGGAVGRGPGRLAGAFGEGDLRAGILGAGTGQAQARASRKPLEGKVALVTGAASGIGKACARRWRRAAQR